MDDSSQVCALLQEIRDLQREHLAEYRAQTARSLQRVEESMQRQKAYLELYRKAVVVGGIVAIVLVVLSVLVVLVVR